MARVLRALAGRAAHLAGGLQPDAVPGPLAWKVPTGRVSNELVHQVDFFTTLVKAGGGTVPADRQIDGMDMSDFLLGGAGESGRDVILCLQGNRLQAVKWHQWKLHLFKQDDMYSTWSPYNLPHVHNLEWDPREEHQIDFGHIWVTQPVMAAASAFLKSLAIEPPIKPGTPDPYTPPPPGQWQPQTILQLGPITQYVIALVKPEDLVPQPPHGIEHQTG
jgi:hypothetical protein